eukprot:4595660-Pyramimonas_sp.AAC.1
MRTASSKVVPRLHLHSSCRIPPEGVWPGSFQEGPDEPKEGKTKSTAPKSKARAKAKGKAEAAAGTPLWDCPHPSILSQPLWLSSFLGHL